MALLVIGTVQLQPWDHHLVNLHLHHLFLHFALWSAWRRHRWSTPQLRRTAVGPRRLIPASECHSTPRASALSRIHRWNISQSHYRLVRVGGSLQIHRLKPERKLLRWCRKKLFANDHWCCIAESMSWNKKGQPLLCLYMVIMFHYVPQSCCVYAYIYIYHIYHIIWYNINIIEYKYNMI